MDVFRIGDEYHIFGLSGLERSLLNANPDLRDNIVKGFKELDAELEKFLNDLSQNFKNFDYGVVRRVDRFSKPLVKCVLVFDEPYQRVVDYFEERVVLNSFEKRVFESGGFSYVELSSE